MKSPECPSCRSTLVIQTDELQTPDAVDVKVNLENNPTKSTTDERDVEEIGNSAGNLQHSESFSSIGEHFCQQSILQSFGIKIKNLLAL